MNRYLSGLFAFFLMGFTLFLSAQETNPTPLDTNYYPLAVGNRWQFVQIDSTFNWSSYPPSSSKNYAVVDYSVTEKTIINNEEYFKINGKWMRYDKAKKIIYLYVNSPKVYLDFKLPVGSIIEGNTVVGKEITTFGNTDYCKGISNSVSGSEFGDESRYFMNNFGMVYYEYTAGSSYTSTTKSLELIGICISDSTQTIAYTDTSGPRISFTSAEINLDNRVSLSVEILHKYSFSPTVYSPDNYISSAFIDYFYFNGVDTVWESRRPMSTQNGTTYNSLVDYKTELIMQGYNLYFRITAADKAIIPNTSFYPVYGFKKIEIASNQIANYYPLKSANKWVYDIEEYNLTTGSHQFVKRQYVYKLKDTLLADNNLYSKMAYDNNIQYERIDPATGITIQYFIDSLGAAQQKILDVLGAQYNKKYFIGRFGIPDTFRCTAISPKTVLHVPNVTTKRMVNLADYRIEYSISNNFGIVAKNYYDYENGIKRYYKALLTAAKIDNVNYGDSTLFVGIEKTETAINPDNFALSQNYPNPFNPNTTIEFNIPRQGDVKLIVYDILGKEINTLINKNLDAGNYSVNFAGTGLSSGIYFYTLKYNGKQTITKKMALTK